MYQKKKNPGSSDKPQEFGFSLFPLEIEHDFL